ncbi:fimbrillin family protein [Sphingobacterium deserti]|uniref:Lipoprotein n=1 Tax=Sphingobacterium deserti TaxID=1229276 RepID=A0A0B8T0K0_9SPHI|nr:fimbrillin family protein [Sphingobacterium deserti]KGE14132.1 hypothetical protein DI53_1962 [Sphingobacterium deserti]
MIHKKLLNCIRLVLCLGTASMLLSCSKDGNEATNQDATLVVNVSGLEEYTLVDAPIELRQTNKSAAHVSQSSANSNLLGPVQTSTDERNEHELHFGKDFDVDFEIVKSHPAGTVATETKRRAGGASMSANRSLVAKQPLGNGIKYRLLIYRENEMQPIVNVEAAGSTFPAVSIASGFNYRWMAISTNESTSAPTVSNNIVSASQIANKDFLYASGTFFSQFGQNYLNIVFKRYTSQIQLTVDSRGMFGNIAANSILSFVMNAGETLSETADFNIQDSSFSNFQPSGLNSNHMTNTDPALRVGTIYTVRPRPVAAGTLQLRLNPLNLTLDDGSTRTYADNTLSFGSAFSPVRGSSYTVTARLIESGVRTGSSRLRWARSNLTYLPTAAEGFRLRFRPHPVNYIFDPNVDLWNYGTLTPSGQQQPILRDPCLRVYPAGTWKMPAREDLLALESPFNLERYTLPETGEVGIVANWRRSPDQPTNSAYDGMDRLRLPFYGYRTAEGTTLQKPAATETQLSGHGHYFSQKYTIRLNEAGQLIAIPTYSRMSYNTSAIAGSTSNLGSYSKEVLEEDATSYNQKRSIRCVRVVNP